MDPIVYFHSSESLCIELGSLLRRLLHLEARAPEAQTYQNAQYCFATKSFH